MSSKKGNDPGVLGSLPTTRPTRLSRRHDDADTGPEKTGNGTAEPAAKASAKTAKTTSKTVNGAAAKTAGPKAKSTAKAARPKAKSTANADGPKAKSTAKAARPKAGSASKRPRAVAGDRRAPKPRGTGPRPVRSGAPALERANDERRRPPRPARPPRGTELVTTAVQAAGELAQFGFQVGGSMLKRAVRRLPRAGRD
jgi:hypothetical protein